MSGKPPYRVPLMTEICTIPWNGLNVISTFSGCGGSCLGYRMAGFRVLWANEFIPEAQVTYRANHPSSFLSTLDIRQVKTADVLMQAGLKAGELDLLDGSPPCSSFSTAGKREAGWGKSKAYSDKAQRTDDLFFEYARFVRDLQPKAFVAENVSGLVKGTAKGYFLEILKVLKGCGYNVEARLLNAQWLGVPQSRQRLIFHGIRNDLRLKPVFPAPLPYCYTVREALPNIGASRMIIGNPDHHKPDGSGWPRGIVRSLDLPSLTVQADCSDIGGARVVLDFPPGSRVIHDTSGNRSAGDITDRPAPTVTVGVNGLNSCHFEDDHVTDISKYAIGAEWDRMGKPGTQSDKYFQLVRPELTEPCPTITATAGVVGAAGVTHPTERRKFTIAELRRICAFPDDFILTGSYQQQWERCGRAVPPVMMSHIAAAVRDNLLSLT